MHNNVDMLNATELYLHIIKMVCFMLHIFYHNQKFNNTENGNIEKKMISVISALPNKPVSFLSALSGGDRTQVPSLPGLSHSPPRAPKNF